MPQLLTTNAQIKCLHGGDGSVASPLAPLATVNGGTVLVEGDTGTIAGCALVQRPCVSFTLRSMNYNATTIDGRRAILVTDFQQTSTFLPLILAETHQAFDDSTTAPLTAGSPAPPLSVALLDVTPPVVTVAPPALTFTHSTQLPPSAVFVFALSSPFPKQWMLTHVSASAAEDLTSGGVPGPSVAPAGGNWASPMMTVVVTLDTAYLNSLSSGVHQFYLTAVSERGIPMSLPATLTVA